MTTEEEFREFLKYVVVQQPDGTRTPLELKDYQLAFLKEVVNNQKDMVRIKRRNR